ncbi:MAG: flagellar biosynthesis anti-sigma factor FlgM [Deltaproteobacteria bacterium]|nr:MAG: flagellar biosynthesis anti-sigma factor FlgM [Deltaproteobacteria bacterium]
MRQTFINRSLIIIWPTSWHSGRQPDWGIIFIGNCLTWRQKSPKVFLISADRRNRKALLRGLTLKVENIVNKLQGLLNHDAAKEVQQSSQAQKAAAQQPAQNVGAVADTVSLSSRSRDIARVAEQVKETPEIRQDLVARMKTVVDAGEYRVDSQDLATKMIREMLMESLL